MPIYGHCHGTRSYRHISTDIWEDKSKPEILKPFFSLFFFLQKVSYSSFSSWRAVLLKSTSNVNLRSTLLDGTINTFVMRLWSCWLVCYVRFRVSLTCDWQVSTVSVHGDKFGFKTPRCRSETSLHNSFTNQQVKCQFFKTYNYM